MDSEQYSAYPQKSPTSRILTVLIVVVVAAIFVVVGFYILLRFQSRAEGVISKPFAQNIAFPYRVNDKQLYFFTGHGFASLDTETLKTSSLGKPRVLPDSPSRIAYGQNGAIIQSSNYTFFDDLGKKVDGTQLGMSVKDSRLWYVPYDGEIIYIDTNVTSSYFNYETSDIYYTTWNNITQKGEIRTVKAGANRSKLLSRTALSSDLHRIVYGGGDDVYFLSKRNSPTELLKLSNGQATSVSNNVFGNTTIGVSGSFAMPSPDYYVAIKSSSDKGQTSRLVRYDLRSHSETELRNSFEGTINLDGDTVVTNGIDGNKMYISTVTWDQLLTPITIDQPQGIISPAFRSLNDFIGVNEISQAILLSPNQTSRPLPEIKSGGLDKSINLSNQGKIYDISFIFSAGPNANTYNANIYPPYDKNITKLFEDIKTAGFDESQLNFVINKTYPTGVNPN